MGNYPNKSCNCSCPGFPYKDGQTLLVAVYSIVFIIGFPANCLTSLLTFVQIQRKKVVAIYIFSLSLCELMYLSTLPLWIIYVQNGHNWTMDYAICKITGFIFFCNIYISILLLCCISVDRYMALVYSLESRWIRGQKKAIIIVCSLFAVAAVIYSPIFYMENDTKCTNVTKCTNETNETNGTKCTNETNETNETNGTNGTTCFETVPLTILFASLNSARFVFGFTIPSIILIFTNYKIFQTTKRSSLTQDQKAKVKYLAIAIIVIFLFCFAPYHVVLITRTIYFLSHPDFPCPFEEKIYPVFTVFLCLCTANAVADPIIYVLVSENVRDDCYRSLRRWRLNSSKLKSSINHSTESKKLEKSKESEEGDQRNENKEIIVLSNIQETCPSGRDQEGES